jgi:hypothetical protein
LGYDTLIEIILEFIHEKIGRPISIFCTPDFCVCNKNHENAQDFYNSHASYPGAGLDSYAEAASICHT